MQEINLYKLLAFYAKNWLLIVSLTLAGLLAGVLYNSYVQVPMFKSNATLLYINEGARSTQDVTLLNNYVQLFNSRRVIEPVMQKLNVERSFEEMAASVSATNEKSTEVLKLSVATDDPELSRSFLREAVISFQEQAEELYGTDNLTVVDNASSAVPPYNVKQPQQLAIATAAGFVVSLITLFFIYDIKGDTVKPKVKKVVAKTSGGKKKPTVKSAQSNAKTAKATKAAAVVETAVVTTKAPAKKPVASKKTTAKSAAKKPTTKKPTTKSAAKKTTTKK